MAAEGRFELFDHTADVGVHVTATDLPRLVEPAVAGLYHVIGELVPTGSPTLREFEYTGDDAAVLLRDYLADLLRLFESQRQMVVDQEVLQFDDSRLAMRAELRPVDEAASGFDREVKAVTYHDLFIRPTADGIEAKYIVDI